MAGNGTDDYFRQLCQHLGTALIATDADLNIVTWNLAAARTFGAAADQMMGTPISRVIPRDRRRMGDRLFRQAIRTGETIQFEFQHRDETGLQRELAGTIAPVVGEKGDRIGASICIRDITRRIGLQDEIHESRKMVALGEMAGAISHHFNNILGGMITSIDFARSCDDPALHRRILDPVASGLQRATALVTGLLAFAEGDRRSEDLSDLTELVNELADELEPVLVDAHIELTLSMAKLPVIPVQRFAVLTVMRNIAQNAVEAMTDGGSLHLDVSVDTGSIVILIEDTGCGLDESTKSRIFEPFWGTKGTLSSDSGKGIGLGLAIAHGLVHMIGGTISVTSQPGEGTSFRVTIPRPRTTDP